MKRQLIVAAISALPLSTFSQNTNTLLPFGNVGIGTLLPSAKLEVKGASLFQGITVTGLSVFKENSVFEKQLSVSGSTVLNGTTIGGALRLTGIPMVPQAAGTYEVVLRDPVTGDVLKSGLGDLPLADLIYSRQPLPCPSGDIALPIWSSKTNTIYVRCPQVKVGIGTDAPSRELHVTGSGLFNNQLQVDDALAVGMSAGAGKISIRNMNRNAGLHIDQSDNFIQYNKLIFLEYNDPGTEVLKVVHKETGVTPFLFTANGAMTVRSNTQKIFQLEESGLLRVRAVKIDLEQNWPDYVFKPAYKLMPLNEVQTYISANGHLPNVPSAEVVETEGIDVGEMAKVMMEKIEELTLYILQQQKEMEEMKLKIQQLEAGK